LLTGPLPLADAVLRPAPELLLLAAVLRLRPEVGRARLLPELRAALDRVLPLPRDDAAVLRLAPLAARLLLAFDALAVRPLLPREELLLLRPDDRLLCAMAGPPVHSGSSSRAASRQRTETSR
jgi:hypothetical protein